MHVKHRSQLHFMHVCIWRIEMKYAESAVFPLPDIYIAIMMLLSYIYDTPSKPFK